MNNVFDDVICYSTSPLLWNFPVRMRDGNWWNPILIRSCHPRYEISLVDGCPDKDPSVLELSARVCVRACVQSFLHTQQGFELLPVNYCKALIPLYGRETDIITHSMFDTSNNMTRHDDDDATTVVRQHPARALVGLLTIIILFENP